MDEASIVIDHLRGRGRGRRQTFPATARVRFGRHPDSDVIFHARRDLDASSRHAELGCDDGGHVLRDVGSSNGTFVHGQRITALEIAPGAAVEAEFGAGGPVVRIFIGPLAQAPAPPGKRYPPARPQALWLLAVMVLVGGVIAALVAWGSLV